MQLKYNVLHHSKFSEHEVNEQKSTGVVILHMECTGSMIPLHRNPIDVRRLTVELRAESWRFNPLNFLLVLQIARATRRTFQVLSLAQRGEVGALHVQARRLQAVPQRGRHDASPVIRAPNAVAILKHERVEDVRCGFFVSLETTIRQSQDVDGCDRLRSPAN